ncbi:MAG: OmpA family protein [Pseudomonadota bacterium]
MKKTALASMTALLALLFITGCPKKPPEYPLCNNDDDCREGETCMDGKCVQCKTDSDCPSGIPCVDGVCKEDEGTGGSGPGDEIAAGKVKTPYEECSIDAIYFDFDSAELKPDAVAALKKTAECLLEKGAKDITIIGHCDPRGTEEYNMGLGLERASTIRKFLVKYGVPEGETTVYSKGEEDATGYDEETWKEDRKGELKK